MRATWGKHVLSAVFYKQRQNFLTRWEYYDVKYSAYVLYRVGIWMLYVSIRQQPRYMPIWDHLRYGARLPKNAFSSPWSAYIQTFPSHQDLGSILKWHP